MKYRKKPVVIDAVFFLTLLPRPRLTFAKWRVNRIVF